MSFVAPHYFSPTFPVTVHRDQDQERPLLGALESGCEFIEMDVHLVEDDLLLGHDQPEAGRRFENIYLQPLKELSDAGRLKGQFSLLVDIKTAGTPTLKALLKILDRYESMLTRFDGERLETRAVQVIVTGKRDRTTLAKSLPRLAFIDGRIGDFSKEIDPNLTPLISDKWEKVVGQLETLPSRCQDLVHRLLCCGHPAPLGPLAEELDDKMGPRLRQARESGARFRPWAMPERQDIWSVLQTLPGSEAFVFNTDCPDTLCQFLEERHAAE
jgi:hypothetical protein